MSEPVVIQSGKVYSLFASSASQIGDLCIDLEHGNQAPGSRLQMFNGLGNENQRWRFEAVDDPDAGGNHFQFFISLAMNSQKVWERRDRQLVIADRIDFPTDAQTFFVRHLGFQWSRITAVGATLGVSYQGGLIPGATVDLVDFGDGKSEKLRFFPALLGH